MGLPSAITEIEPSASWLTVAGSSAPELAAALQAAVERKISAGTIKRQDVDYIGRINRELVAGTLRVSDSKLEKLRRLCQLWEVDMKVGPVTSHRKYVGPIIVTFKNLLFPILRVLLKDTFRQQRDFNAAAISLLTELCQEEEK